MQPRGTPYSPEEDEAIRRGVEDGKTDDELARELGRTAKSINHRRREHLKIVHETAIDQRKAANKEAAQRIRSASMNPEADTASMLARIAELERQLAIANEQKKWEQQADLPSMTGGLMTLRESDRHNGDENHLINCAAILEDKFCMLIERYQPDRIQWIGFDDWIAGRGIFREQDLQSAVPDPEQQIAVGAVKARRFLEKIRRVTQAPISVKVLRGNHEYAPGKTSLGNYLFLQVRTLCEDIPGVAWEQCHDRALVNLSDQGHYHVLAFHGFGHSKNSPNSPAFIDAAKDAMLRLQRQLPPDQHIRRVLSGHTHVLSVGLEMVADLPFDTTGGLQRNNRVMLGMNERPCGWIVYVSPKGSVGEIAKPIELRPDSEVRHREMSDPHLPALNRKDCGECLIEYEQLMTSRGLMRSRDEIGVTQGRW